jgi:uncharacterized protein HemX
MKLEDELRRALARENPPEDFAGRVAARIQSTGRQPGVVAARGGVLALAVAATIALAAASTVYYAHQRQVSQVTEAERVRREAVAGLRIASAKLNEVHERLLHRINNQSERVR